MRKKRLTYSCNANDHKAIGDFLKGLWEEGGNYLVTVEKNRPVRSLNANKYYHAIVNIIAMETGHMHDELHEALKMKFNSKTIFVEKKDKSTIAEQVAEALVPPIVIGASTSDLDTAEFASYVNRVKNWAQQELGIIIPEAKDVDYQRWQEIEDRYNESQQG